MEGDGHIRAEVKSGMFDLFIPKRCCLDGKYLTSTLAHPFPCKSVRSENIFGDDAGAFTGTGQNVGVKPELSLEK